MIKLERAQEIAANDFLSSTDSYPRRNTETGNFDDGLSAFLDVRRKLLTIASRMLRSAARAEDIVQDVWLRWQTTNRSVVLDPPSFLMTITTRMCINLIRSASFRRETYAGHWLADPVDTGDDPFWGVARKEGLKIAVLILLEKLRPAERAAYILREAFNYSSRQIADVLHMKETNVRQLLSRARRRMAEGRRARASIEERRRLLTAFIDAAQNGSLTKLEDFLASDVIIRSPLDDSVINQASSIDLECFLPEQNWTSCHKTLECSVLPDTTDNCEGSGHNESDDHEGMQEISVGFLQSYGFVRAVSIACE
jgi:RNA polymerase sigma-70 factor (ECF subfamily)